VRWQRRQRTPEGPEFHTLLEQRTDVVWQTICGDYGVRSDHGDDAFGANDRILSVLTLVSTRVFLVTWNRHESKLLGSVLVDANANDLSARIYVECVDQV
jgi:hypothetical protein